MNVVCVLIRVPVPLIMKKEKKANVDIFILDFKLTEWIMVLAGTSNEWKRQYQEGNNIKIPSRLV